MVRGIPHITRQKQIPGVGLDLKGLFVNSTSKMGKNHRKINNRFRVNYIKNESKQKREKDFKKTLRNWLLSHCQDNRQFFGLLLKLSKDRDYKTLADRIRDEWMHHDANVRATDCAFMNNTQYISALVDYVKADISADTEIAEDSDVNSETYGEGEGGAASADGDSEAETAAAAEQCPKRQRTK